MRVAKELQGDLQEGQGRLLWGYEDPLLWGDWYRQGQAQDWGAKGIKYQLLSLKVLQKRPDLAL